MGKSTIASSAAVYLAGRGRRVRLVSTDYTPSLGFLLGLSSDEGELLGGRLRVSQLSEEKIKMLWKKRFGDEVYEVASSLFPVGREVIDYIAGAPGIVEEFALYYVYEAWRQGGFDVLVWDTMAAGGGLRMLRIEREFYAHLSEAAKMYLRVKGVLERIRRGSGDVLELIEEWRSLAESILRLLSSQEHRAVLVSRPYPLDVDVAYKILGELKEFGINVAGFIVNMGGNGCGGMPSPCCSIPVLAKPPKGVGELAKLAGETCLGDLIEKVLA